MLYHQLLVHEPTIASSVITNRFVDGLKEEIHSVIMVHRQQDLDTASSLALLQEEALQDFVGRETRKHDYSAISKKYSTDNVKTSSFLPTKSSTQIAEDKRVYDSGKPKTVDDRLSSLKSYRKAKGLCFKCGEKWSPSHKCAATVSLHAMEEVWQVLNEDSHPSLKQDEEEEESDNELMAISLQAMRGVEGARTIRFRGFIAEQEVFMLVDSGSSHCFITDQLTHVFSEKKPLDKPVSVQVANGEKINCSHELIAVFGVYKGIPSSQISKSFH